MELEPNASLQVPLLLKLGQHERALSSATQSGDTELVSNVLLNMKEKQGVRNFHVSILNFTFSVNTIKKLKFNIDDH